ncbi:MAG: LysR family transcriptional regulator [Labilithrix sp.]|nr:LysR family transcriptional regulator [Labilithrix sp.]MCW5809960.1 LysR family transcriptional regulator [Labilithrix sp.]
MKRTTYRWDDLKVLLELLRSGSLSGAGQALGVNASTIGRRLEALEAALGVQLFERTADGVVATAAADALRDAAEAVERSVVNVDNVLDALEAAPEGTVRISAPPAICTHFIAPAVARLRRRFPRLQVQLDASAELADLTLREADVAVRLVRPTSGDLFAMKLGDSPTVVFVATDARVPEPLADPNDVDWITWTTHDLPDARWVKESVKEERVAVRASSLEAQMAAARGGAGALLLSRAFRGVPGLRELRLAPALEQRLAARPDPALWLVTHRALRRVPRVEAAWELLLEEGRRFA